MTLALDLTDRVLHSTEDLSEFWRDLRHNNPVHWLDPTDGGPGFWVLTTYEHVSAVYRDTKHFTSERGNVMDALRAGGDSAAKRMLSLTDGPRHAGIRSILMKTFSKRGVEQVGTRIRSVARSLVESALAAGECDFAKDVAAPIPLMAICDLLGVPEEDRWRIFDLTSSMVASETPDHTQKDAWRNKNEVLFYFANMAEGRRVEPRDDIVSLLTAAQIENAGLTEDEIIFNCYSLILGGGETTRMSIGGAVLALIQNPSQWQALKSGAVSIDSAVEEVLRWTTPSMHMARTALSDVEIGGKLIRAGDIVTLWNVSANRDETVFDSPDTFDLARTPNKHVTLGGGSHFCLGAHLARLEINAVLTALRDMVSGMELAGEPRRIYSNFLGGVCHVPVSLR
ncbi:cytochrome P450 [Lentzea sp. NBRC 105346]|uniref:cytochrome P450 n=1 Tax=Lentzea sp. NBRC 105346 TaxID=3032205 RepID=UPI0024A2607D|nr:cytochrome P450 [Lentzea sp. NBRC 105346]GLZ35175.1 cytochrome P450 [Lentzea sp. NBRC 105346]